LVQTNSTTWSAVIILYYILDLKGKKRKLNPRRPANVTPDRKRRRNDLEITV